MLVILIANIRTSVSKQRKAFLLESSATRNGQTQEGADAAGAGGSGGA